MVTNVSLWMHTLCKYLSVTNALVELQVCLYVVSVFYKRPFISISTLRVVLRLSHEFIRCQHQLQNWKFLCRRKYSHPHSVFLVWQLEESKPDEEVVIRTFAVKYDQVSFTCHVWNTVKCQCYSGQLWLLLMNTSMGIDCSLNLLCHKESKSIIGLVLMCFICLNISHCHW